MKKITNANMFNWAKKKERDKSAEPPKVRRKGSFSLTDTLRKSVIKAKFKDSKKDEDKTPQKPQVLEKNPQIPNGSAQNNPETVNANTEISPQIPNGSTQTNTETENANAEISQITAQVSDMTANIAQIGLEELKIDDKNEIDYIDQESSIEISEDKSNKEEVKISKRISQISLEKVNISFNKKEDSILNDGETNPENINVNNELTQPKVQISKISKISIEELKTNDEILPDKRDQESSEELKTNGKNILHNTNQELALEVNENISNKEEISPHYENVIYNKNQKLPLEVKENESNKEEIQKSNRISQIGLEIEDNISVSKKEECHLNSEKTKPGKVNVNNETTQETIQVSQMTADVAKISIEELKINNENIVHTKNEELSLEVNQDELSEEEIENSHNVSQNSFEKELTHLTQLTVQLSQISTNNANISKEEIKIINENALHNGNQQSPVEINEGESNKEEISPHYENVLYNRNQELSIEINEDESNKKEEQKTKIISQISLEKENLSIGKKEDNKLDNEETNPVNIETQITVQVPQLIADNTKISIEELKTNDENMVHDRNQESSIKINEVESDEEEEPKTKRISQISFEKEDIPSSKKDDKDLDKEKTNPTNVRIEELKTNDENILHNRDQKKSVEVDEEKSNKKEEKEIERISQTSCKKEDSNLVDDETDAKFTIETDTEISIEEIKINDEIVLKNRNQESSLEVNKKESRKEEVQNSRRISQISFEAEDLSFSIKEDSNLDNEESNENSCEDKNIRRNSSLRRSFKVELTIIESQNDNKPRRYSQILLEKESNRCSSNKSETEYPEELNPFAEDEDEETEVKSVKTNITHHEKQNLNDSHYNPFDSESETEETISNGDSCTLQSKNNTLTECTSLTTSNKNIENSEVKRIQRDRSKSGELPGGSLPPSPIAPARRRLPQARSLQCLQECGKPTALPRSTQSILSTSSGISSAGSNPFEDDDENELEDTSGQDKPKLQLAAHRLRPPRPPSPTLSVSSMTSTPSKSLNGSTQYNPFDEDEEDEELEKSNDGIGMRGATSRSSLADSPSHNSTFKRDPFIRGSLPPSAKPRKKRQAPLPPGQLPPTIPDENRYNGHMQQGPSSTSTPRKNPPPRPPPPRVQKIV